MDGDMEAPNPDMDMTAADADAVKELDEMKKRLKEMEDEAAALREMQAKVEKEMGAQDLATMAANQAGKEEVDARVWGGGAQRRYRLVQSWEKKIDRFQLGEGVMPASFKVFHDPVRNHETLIADFGASAIGRVAPVDSGFGWIILLRAYTKSTGDSSLADMPECQKAMRLILSMCLSEGFHTFPTLLCADGCCMIDSRMFCKNIVLAGVGSVTLLDDRLVTVEAFNANFLILPDEDAYAGKTVAEICCDSLKEFNPIVHVSVEKGDLSTLGVDFFEV